MTHAKRSANQTLGESTLGSTRLQRNGSSIVVRLPSNPDAERLEALLAALVQRVFLAHTSAIIFDFSETRLLDVATAGLIENAAAEIRLFGPAILLCEIQAPLSRALTEFDLTFPDIVKLGTIDQALDVARNSHQ